MVAPKVQPSPPDTSLRREDQEPVHLGSRSISASPAPAPGPAQVDGRDLPADALDRAVADRSGTLAQLEHALNRAKQLISRIESSDSTAGPVPDLELKRRLAASEDEVDTLSRQLVELENRTHQLMNLYVATYQLYAGRELGQVQEAIAEITRDLVGAKSFVLLLEEPGAHEERSLTVALQHGSAGRYAGAFENDTYRGGIPAVDRLLENPSRVAETHPGPAEDLLAIVPLKFDDYRVGLLLVFELFEHKSHLSSGDREILDLLGAHAASALAAALNHSATARRLQTLESLVKLIKGEP